jgi:hypothetical protein
MSVVGSFNADGNGNITAGNADVAIAGDTRTNQGLTQSTYSVGPDNSGTMRLNTAVNYPTGSVSFTFSFALDSFSSLGVAAGGRLIESDSDSFRRQSVTVDCRRKNLVVQRPWLSRGFSQNGACSHDKNQLFRAFGGRKHLS